MLCLATWSAVVLYALARVWYKSSRDRVWYKAVQILLNLGQVVSVRHLKSAAVK